MRQLIYNGKKVFPFFEKTSYFLCLLFLLSAPTFCQPPKVLVVVAHPDDETAMSVAIYKITHEQKGIVDQAVITNGEGGYRYSLLSESYYNLNLTDETVGRENLPRIRKTELMNAGKVIGVRNYYFFDQKDAHYGLNEKEPLDTSWNTAWVLSRLKELMSVNKYDFVFCLLPDSSTHGGHKAATILALTAAVSLKERPVVLGVTGSEKTDLKQRSFTGLTGRPITNISRGAPSFSVDRTVSFGFKNALNYKVIANWEIAEHKSQGTMQLYMNRGDQEDYWLFDANDGNAFQKGKQFFDLLNSKTPETK